MAITRNKKDSFVQIDTSTKQVADIIPPKAGDKPDNKPSAQEKKVKTGFWATTIAEIAKVEWPTWQYVSRWASIIIIFTALISSFLGFFDHIFVGGIKYIECTSQTSDVNYSECGDKFFKYVTFR